MLFYSGILAFEIKQNKLIKMFMYNKFQLYEVKKKIISFHDFLMR